MIRSFRQRISAFAVIVTLGPAALQAQGSPGNTDQPRASQDGAGPVVTTDSPGPVALRQAIIREVERQARGISARPVWATAQAAPQKAAKKPMSRGKKTAIAAAIGGGIGAIIGLSLEDNLDMPEGSGALMFGGIGAGLGALIVLVSHK